ncbi:MAG TPA: DUF2249 domain-containing protein [Flavobacteriaceae bacterium]|nr:DUF2249 domain-containing protein [Flavobacteriaceae bacterium]HIP27313.1 DUF2249 domain-containing protein [Flavobacteriaceae bacterium]
MLINKDTKISKIIKENMDAIDTIASINKNFLKLKNPILRRVLAPRVSVKDAAKIGKNSINEFLKRLEQIGFEVSYENNNLDKEELKDRIIRKNNSEKLNVISLDVRPTIESGADPFKEIMQAVKKLKKDETLKIINVFKPIPLINILKEKGYKTWTDVINDNEYHTFFTKETPTNNTEIIKSMPITKGSFEEKLASFGSNLKEIEVRHLEMPEPMITILAELENLADNHVLLVNHKKVPQFLLPELKTRNYQWMSKDIEPGYTLLIIFK